MCNILRALYRGSVARPRRWHSSCPVGSQHSSRASPARCTTWKGIHDRPRAGEFFGGSARKAGESIHRDDLNALAPSGPVCKLLMGLLSGPLGVVRIR